MTGVDMKTTDLWGGLNILTDVDTKMSPVGWIEHTVTSVDMKDDRLVGWVEHTVTGGDMKTTGLWSGLNTH